MREVYYVWKREMKLWLSEKWAIVMIIVEAILYLGLFSLAMEGIVKNIHFYNKEVSYFTFIAPGVIIMNIFTISLIGGFLIFIDRRSGMLELILTSPIKRYKLILGRLFGAITRSMVAGITVLLVSMSIGANYPLTISDLLFVLMLFFLISIGFAGLTIGITSKITEVQTYNTVINAMILPVIFTSSIFYPKEAMPSLLKIVASFNPLSYATEIVRVVLLTNISIADSLTIVLYIAIFSIIMSIFAIHSYKGTMDEVCI